jgi:Druantia protein DruA
MDSGVKYQGRIATRQDIEFIRKLISENPGDSRRALSQKLCKAWNWIQANGALRDMVCRGFMLRLESAGYIKLPPRKFTPNNPLANRKRPQKADIDKTPVSTALSKNQPLEIRQVRRTLSEKLFNSLISQYHYLGYCHPVGEHLKYMVFTQGRPIACLAWSSAPRHISCRDKFIGWSPDIRKKNLHLIAYNSRFLVLPWVKIKNLASHLLGAMIKVLPVDWQRAYNHPIYFLETFVDTERFRGTCYHAANWIYLGNTTGRGKNDQTHRPNRSIKAVLGYPLSKNFQEILRHG